MRASFPAKSLSDWYQRNKRDLPWRKDPKPYNVWISEIMLQQTQVETVLPYYERFLKRFPDLKALSAAAESEVLELWSGLGYYSRARNLLKAAKAVAHNGKAGFPEDYDGILSLPGIGPYTAGAIWSIAFDKPAPILDGNVRRVLSRFYLTHSQAGLWDISKDIVERAWKEGIRPSDFNQALMETGALVCLPKNPLCGGCPLRSGCGAKKKNLQAHYPQSRKAQKPVRRDFALAILGRERRAGGQREYLLCRRSSRQRWLKDAWEFPMVRIPKTLLARQEPLKAFEARFSKKMGTPVLLEKSLGRVKHSITRHNLQILILKGKMKDPEGPARQSAWMKPSELKSVFSSSILKKALVLVR